MKTSTETVEKRIERLYRLLALNRDIRTRNYPERDAELWTVQALIWEQAVSISKDLETTAKRIKRDADRACWLLEP
ncbi:hypothetical protein H7F08_11210 [Acidithiobacillus sp. HP-11]|nr:hypothetical protein [Acidithiobacillus sp. HP-11]